MRRRTMGLCTPEPMNRSIAQGIVRVKPRPESSPLNALSRLVSALGTRRPTELSALIEFPCKHLNAVSGAHLPRKLHTPIVILRNRRPSRPLGVVGLDKHAVRPAGSVRSIQG